MLVFAAICRICLETVGALIIHALVKPVKLSNVMSNYDNNNGIKR